MKPLLVLLIVFGVAAYPAGIHLAGNIAMAAMLCFTALGHFKFPRGMASMIPGPVPFRKELVYGTGVAEVLVGMGLIFHSTRLPAALLLLALLVLMLPANIYAAAQHINYETGGTDGPGLRYLWFRVPLQLLFIGWVVYFSLPL